MLASFAAVEVINLSNLVTSMGFAQTVYTPAYDDSKACINLKWSYNNSGRRERAKHIDVHKHFAHEAIQNGHLRLSCL
jgi:hypothetical protein